MSQTHPATADDRPRSRRRAPSPKRGRRLRRGLLLGLLVVLLTGGGTAWWLYHGLDSNLKDGAVDLDRALGDEKNRPARQASAGDAVNLLVLGSDSRAGDNAALAGGSTDGARADTTLLVHIAAGRTEAVAVSIPRDTLVTRPACTGRDGTALPSADRVMFNSVYAQAGPACTAKTVEKMSRVRVDHLVEVDFAGFKEIVDAIGGVPLTVREDLHDRSAGLDLAAGTHRLDGTEALAFVRSRKGVGDGSDLGRIGRQQQFMTALLAEIRRQDLLGHPTRTYRIADSLTGSLTTDSELASLSALVDFGRSLDGIDPAAMETIMLPVEYDRVDPNRVVAVEPQASALWRAVRADEEIPASARRSPANGGTPAS
ncbi:LCP family protein [Streptomyces cadmiisoli]|uniref:LCP family protein n=1 Tax=Streptomyces cadmiisoli TaxID=2184053 RepID=UPI003D7130DC